MLKIKFSDAFPENMGKQKLLTQILIEFSTNDKKNIKTRGSKPAVFLVAPASTKKAGSGGSGSEQEAVFVVAPAPNLERPLFENKNKGDFIEFHVKSNYLQSVKFFFRLQ